MRGHLEAQIANAADKLIIVNKETYTNYEFYITGSDREAPTYKSVMTDRLGEDTYNDLVVPPSGSTASVSSSHMVIPVDKDGNPLKRKKYSSDVKFRTYIYKHNEGSILFGLHSIEQMTHKICRIV